jgi:soluble lytic murein transglycosylase
MRGIGYTLSRLPSARVLFAGAAIIAGTFTSAAHGQSSGSGNGSGTLATDNTRADQAAWSMPHRPHDSASGVAFPQPLRPTDAAVMQRIFAFQRRGDIPNAIRSSADLEDPLLLGSVLADRYLGRYHISTPAELSEWLAKYRDLPDAVAIHQLLLTKLPKGATPPAPLDVPVMNRSSGSEMVLKDIEPPRNDMARNRNLDQAVLDRALGGNTASALRLISSARGISAAYGAQLRAEVAQVAFTQNEDAEALRIVQALLKSTSPDDQAALAYYIGGLAAWRLDRPDVARAMFENGAETAITASRLHAASAFWASRVSRRLNDAAGTVKWLRVAAEGRVTLHGLLARRILGMDIGLLPSGRLLSQADVDAVAATPQGLRAFALLQIGQSNRAEAELRGLWPLASADSDFGRSLLMVASATGMTNSAADMADWLQSQDGQGREALRFPMPRLQPAGGFRVDPALVYALARQESNFNPEAISPAGARGLMQIMPATAQYITGDLMLTANRLHEPAANLQIGQRYVTYLARLDGIGNDLIRVLASYNCGPGSVARWSADIRDDGDPLLFIEAIPIAETRAFVPHVLTYSWLYAARLHRRAPSLDSFVDGEFPRFTPLEREGTIRMVTNAGLN